MKLIIRLLAVIIVAPATYSFVFWMPCSLFLSPLDEYGIIAGIIISLICATIASWYIWKKLGAVNPGAITCILAGAVITGAIGFTAGFFGPIIFSPEANQGPLLGIFITGPLGFLLGGIGGGIYWAVRKGTAQADL